MFFPGKMMSGMKGNKIEKVRIALFSANFLSDLKVWICGELDGEPIVSKDVPAPVASAWTEAVFDVPYEIDGKGVYVGYSFTLSKVEDVQTDGSPIGTNMGSTENALFFKSGGAWRDLYGMSMGDLMLQAFVTGDFKERDVAIDNVTYGRSLAGGEFRIGGVLTNYGTEDVSSVDLSYVIDGRSDVARFSLGAPLASGGQGEFSFMAKAPAAPARYAVRLDVDKVDGAADENADNNSALSQLIVMSESAPRRTVVEQGTSLDNGTAPLGIAGIRKLEEMYAGDVTGILLHDFDELQADSYIPMLRKVGSSGTAVDRVLVTRPYRGEGSDPFGFGLGKVFEECNSRPSEAALSLSAEWTDDSKACVEVRSAARFSYNDDKALYRMAYVIVEDGVTGSVQTNDFSKDYYEGMYGQGSSSELPSDLSDFTDKPHMIEDMVFDGIARGIYDCAGIEGSLEGSIVTGQEKSHSYVIEIPPCVQNKDNIRVVAMLLDEMTGEVVNAAEAAVGGVSGIGHTDMGKLDAEVSVTPGGVSVTASAPVPVTADVYTLGGSLVGSATFTGHTVITVRPGTFIIRVSDGDGVAVRKVTI